MNKQKILLIVALIFLAGLIALLSGFKAMAPSNLKLNVTFDRIEVYNGASWVELVSNQTTVNLLDSAITGGTGQSINVNSLSSGTYTAMRLYISAIQFEQGGATQDVLPTIKYNSGSSLYPETIPILPFVVSNGSSLVMNFYMPEKNIAGSTIGSYEVFAPPTIFVETVGTSEVASSQVATLNISAALSSTTSNCFVGIFSKAPNGPGVEPTMGGQITNTNGTASGKILLPPGTYYLGAFEDVDNTGMSNGGPNDGDKIYFYGSIGQQGPTFYPVTAEAGQTTNITLTYGFDQSSSNPNQNLGGGSGEASIKIAFAPASGTTIAPTAETNTFIAFFTSSPASGQSNPCMVLMTQIPAGSFTSKEYTAQHLPYGTYYICVLVDTGNNMSSGPTSGDYMGFYGGLQSPGTVEVTAASPNADVSSSPVQLVSYDSLPH